jgi:hypothetical protein
MPDPAHQLNRSVCQADFSYTMTLDLIKIVDLNLGNKSVTNDIENVLRKIEGWHQGSIAGFKIMYRDSDGYWDGINWNGQHATFFALRETSEAAAENELRARKDG